MNELTAGDRDSSSTSPALRWPEDIEHLVLDHARRAYPEECCGILLGRRDGTTTVVVRAQPADNQRESLARHNRYLIEPRTILEADKLARALGLAIVGYYHSHPDHPARPSEFDREHAWPDTSYVIVAVERGKVVATRSWRLSDDRSEFTEEAIRPLDT